MSLLGRWPGVKAENVFRTRPESLTMSAEQNSAINERNPTVAATGDGPDLAVVVPVHNETENLRSLIFEISTALENVASFEIIYVDDASVDETPVTLRALEKDVPELRVITHKTCYGQSMAIATGVQAARAAVIATLDGDGQNDPADIPALYARYLQSDQPDLLMVAGWRAKRKDSGLKKISSRIANRVRGGLLGDGTPDTGCGLKIFSRTAFLDMPRFDHMHRFLPALMIRRGGKVVSVKVNHRPRQQGVSKYGLWNRLWVGIVDMFGVMWLNRRAKVVELKDDKDSR